jgi:hypothetical protein
MRVRIANVRMTSEPGAFEYSLNSIGSFSFNMQLPPKPVGGGKLLFYRVIGGDYSVVSLKNLTDTDAQFIITPPADKGNFFWRILLGYLDQPWIIPDSAANMRYTVSLDYIKVRDDLDESGIDCYPDDTAHNCGEWTLYMALNDAWQEIWHNQTVWDGADAYPVHATYPVLDDGGRLRLRVTGYDNDDPIAGDRVSQGEFELGYLADLCCGQHTFETAHWKLWYTVTEGGDTITALPPEESVYWYLRLEDEPNDPERVDLGDLPVPITGAPALVTKKKSYLDKGPYSQSITIVSNDIDRYRFALSDFADVSFGPMPADVTVELEKTFPWTVYAGTIPPEIAAQVGYKSAWINVFTYSPHITDQEYTLEISTVSRHLDPDWGEGMDAAGGRIVDLVTPELGTQVVSYKVPSYETRSRTKDWAWQHVVGDVDIYDVVIPPVKEKPLGYVPCPYEMEGELTLEAYGMILSVPALGLEGIDTLTLTNLNANFPTHHIQVLVRHPSNSRGIYRLQATWNDAGYFTVPCPLFRTPVDIERVIGTPLDLGETYRPGLGCAATIPDIQPMTLLQLGGYRAIQIDEEGLLDTVLSTVGDRPVIARLYDDRGVLVGEGTALGEESVGLPSAEGQSPRAALKVPGLTVGAIYLLQVVPAFGLGSAQLASRQGLELPVGFTQQQPSACPATTPTPTATARATATPSATARPTATPTPSATSGRPTATPTASATARATVTPTPTASATARATATSTPTASATARATATSTPTASATARATVTPTPTASATARATATSTPTASATARSTATPTATLTPSATARVTATRTPTATPTPSATARVTATRTPTATPTPSATARVTATRTPTATPTRGLLLGQDHSDGSFAAPDNAPIASIAWPLKSARFLPEVQITLDGQGDDIEDSSVADSDLTCAWSAPARWVWVRR